MEGSVDELQVNAVESGGFSLRARCFASYNKNLRQPVEITLDEDQQFLDSVCPCTAGQNACSHVVGVIYVAQLCQYVRVADSHDESSDDAEVDLATDDVPCTSKPRAWGLPGRKRKVAPTVQLESLNFKRVSLEKDFSPVLEDSVVCDPRPSSLRTVHHDTISALSKDMGKWSSDTGRRMVHIYFATPKEDSQAITTEIASPFNNLRPKPFRLPARFSALHENQCLISGKPTQQQLNEWKEQFITIMSEVDRDEIEQGTVDQAACGDWYLERVCRITASKAHSIVTQVSNFDNLARQHLYVAPPTYPRFGHDNEPVAVELLLQEICKPCCLVRWIGYSSGYFFFGCFTWPLCP